MLHIKGTITSRTSEERTTEMVNLDGNSPIGASNSDLRREEEDPSFGTNVMTVDPRSVPADDNKLINLDQAQRRGLYRHSIMIFGIFFVYLVVGMVMFNSFLGWDLLETVYFICITFSTVGYGDLTADHTKEERIFTSAYLLVGLIAIASFLSIYLQIVTDQAEALARKRSKEFADGLAISSSGVAHTIYEKMKSIKRSSAEIGRSISRTLSIGSHTGSVADNDHSPAMKNFQEDAKGGIFAGWNVVGSESATKSALYSEYEKDKETKSLTEEDAHRLTAVTEANSASLEKSAVGLKGSGAALMGAAGAEAKARAMASGDTIPDGDDGANALYGASEEPDDGDGVMYRNGLSIEDQENLRNTLDLLRDRQSVAREGAAREAMNMGESMEDIIFKTYDKEIRSKLHSAVWSMLLIVIIIVVGTVCMIAIEGWSFDIAFYWACQTVTTVGYGDFPPNSRDGKLFTIFYIVIGLGSLATAITHVVDYPMALRARHVEEKVLNQFGGDLSNRMLQKIFHSEIYERHPHLQANKEAMGKSEFVILLLEMMNKIDEKDILLASRVFKRLDINGDGELSIDDMEKLKEDARLREEEEQRQAQEAEEERRRNAKRRGTFVSPRRGSEFSAHGGGGEEEGEGGDNIIDMLSRATRRMSHASMGLFTSGRSRFASTDSRTTSKDSVNTWDRRLGALPGTPESGGSSGLQSFLESDIGSPAHSAGHRRGQLSTVLDGDERVEPGAGDVHGHSLNAPLRGGSHQV